MLEYLYLFYKGVNMPRKRYIVFELSSLTLSLLFCKEHYFIRRVVADL